MYPPILLAMAPAVAPVMVLAIETDIGLGTGLGTFSATVLDKIQGMLPGSVWLLLFSVPFCMWGDGE
jgi:hypothetical protein